MAAYKCPRCANVAEGDPATLRCPRCGYPGPLPSGSAMPVQAPTSPAATAPMPFSPTQVPASRQDAAGTHMVWQDVTPARQHPATSLANALIVLLAVSILFSALGLAFVRAAPARVDALQALVAVLSGLVSVATVVVFCVWLHRVCSNAKAAHPGAGIRPGWAVGSFFIPVAQLFLPYPPIRAALRAHGPAAEEGRLLAWFVAWAVGTAVSFLLGMLLGARGIQRALEAVRAHQDVSTIQPLPETPAMMALRYVGVAANVLAAVLLAVVATRWSHWQDAQARGGAASGPSRPSP